MASNSSDVRLTATTPEELAQELRSLITQTSETSAKNIADVRASISVLSRFVDSVKNSLCQLEEDVERLQVDNSRLTAKNTNTWMAITRVQDQICELQESRFRKAESSDQPKQNMSYLRQNLPFVTYFAAYAVLAGFFFWMMTRFLQRDFRRGVRGYENNEDS